MPIEVDSAAVDAALASMIDQLKAFPDKMANEVNDWQVEDMKRRYPNIERPDEQTVETDVWPRSRLARPYKSRGTPRGRPPGRRLPAMIRALRGLRPAPSTRPILRQELWDTLVERMRDLLGTLSFKSK